MFRIVYGSVIVILVVSLMGCSGDGAVTLKLEGGNDIFRKNDARQNMPWYNSHGRTTEGFSGMGSK